MESRACDRRSSLCMNWTVFPQSWSCSGVHTPNWSRMSPSWWRASTRRTPTGRSVTQRVKGDRGRCVLSLWLFCMNISNFLHHKSTLKDTETAFVCLSFWLFLKVLLKLMTLMIAFHKLFVCLNDRLEVNIHVGKESRSNINDCCHLVYKCTSNCFMTTVNDTNVRCSET